MSNHGHNQPGQEVQAAHGSPSTAGISSSQSMLKQILHIENPEVCNDAFRRAHQSCIKRWFRARMVNYGKEDCDLCESPLGSAIAVMVCTTGEPDNNDLVIDVRSDEDTEIEETEPDDTYEEVEEATFMERYLDTHPVEMVIRAMRRAMVYNQAWEQLLQEQEEQTTLRTRSDGTDEVTEEHSVSRGGPDHVVEEGRVGHNCGSSNLFWMVTSGIVIWFLVVIMVVLAW